MSNCLFTRLLYNRPRIHPAHPNWQTNKGKVFSCFVDFKKAFDSIWHEGLLCKLMESGVGGKTWDIIKSMYTNNKCAVKIGKKTYTFLPTGPWGETAMQLKPHPLQHIYQRIDEGTRKVYSTQPHSTRIWSQMSTVCWWSSASVTNHGGPTATPRFSAQILPDLGPDSKSQ